MEGGIKEEDKSEVYKEEPDDWVGEENFKKET
jgi:hypothetical protein